MAQYVGVKAQHPDAIVLFRVGDFYETFSEDAIKTSKILGIVLTSRNNGGSDVELAGFPHHSLDVYLPKLVKAGYRVAICEQLEKPSKEKKIVKRGVTDLITPGLTFDEKILDHKSNNYLCSVHYTKKNIHGISFLDVSTGEFYISQGGEENIDKLIQSFNPSEIIFSRGERTRIEKRTGDQYYLYALEEWIYTLDYGRDKLLNHFQTPNLKGFGIEEMEEGQVAAGAILHYLHSTENNQLNHIQNIQRIYNDDYVWLDHFTIRNLELVSSNQYSGISLLQILDKTVSPMGARLLKKWIILPLKEIASINYRLDFVEYLINNENVKDELTQKLKLVGDLERLVSKIVIGRINPREVNQLKKSLFAVQDIKNQLEKANQKITIRMSDVLQACTYIRDKIGSHIEDEPPVNISKGDTIKEGVNEELDDLKNTIRNSKDLLIQIQQEEAQRTGITSLKIGFNSVFGYYLEVTNKYKDRDLIPEDWVRKQTLTNAERYITDALKKLETKILTAEEKIQELEEQVYYELIEEIKDFIMPLQSNAKILAELDCFTAFANLAIKNRYVKPILNNGFVINIKDGRHPVIEKQLNTGDQYIPNDTYLDDTDQQIMMITGPNMSGKSAVLRQTALICLMAQMGCYVPASSAEIGIVDKIFTRVGASDNISGGESTFMVEMIETASIMNNLSNRSLILLDEIGRGTSTYDGISIAWSIAEYLHNHPKFKAKTLFATHYHELNDLATNYPRIKNFNIATKEIGHKVLFLRKLQEGGSNHSFGIHVAKMANMPNEVIHRAMEILTKMEEKSLESGQRKDEGLSQKLKKQVPEAGIQLSIFETVDPTAGKIKQILMEMDLNVMTPIDCMLKLKELIGVVEEN